MWLREFVDVSSKILVIYIFRTPPVTYTCKNMHVVRLWLVKHAILKDGSTAVLASRVSPVCMIYCSGTVGSSQYLLHRCSGPILKFKSSRDFIFLLGTWLSNCFGTFSRKLMFRVGIDRLIKIRIWISNYIYMDVITHPCTTLLFKPKLMINFVHCFN